jgi:hypothetical protein
MNGEWRMNLTFWKNFSPFMKRIVTVIMVFVFAVVITTVGTLTPIRMQEANELSNELNRSIEMLKESGSLLQYIFGNNFMIALLMFVPIVGLIFGGYVLYNTGIVIAAIAITEGFHPTLAFLILFLTPIAWLEFVAYSTAMAESIWLTRRLLQRRGKHELTNTAKFIAICAVVLLVAAIIETALIL